MLTKLVPGTDPSQVTLNMVSRWPRLAWMASWSKYLHTSVNGTELTYFAVPADQELQQWHRISRPIGTDDRAPETETHHLPHIAPVDPNRGERLDTEAIRLALSSSAHTPPSDNEPSDDEDIFASDDEHDRWRDTDHRLTMDDLYIGGARPVDLTTSDDRAHHTCLVCLQVKSHPVMYAPF
jgi:hypothetical protein